MKIKNPNGRSAKDGTGNYVDVLIIGAGLAGLGAATKLQSTGQRFLILEGQAKAGGRVNTLNMRRNVKSTDSNENRKSTESDDECIQSTKTDFVDAGASWLHGKFNHLHDIAERYDLLSTEQSEEGLGAYLRDDGEAIDDYFVKKIDFLIGQILCKCETYAREDQTDYPKSVYSFLLDNFSKYLDTLEDATLKVTAQQLFDWHVRFQVIDNSCLNLDHVSAKSWGAYSYNGESCQAHYNFRNGFSAAIEALCNQVDRKNILFKKEVVEIVTSASCPRISVKCSDNTIYHANHVIVTLSLGCLKTNLHTMFRPALPHAYVQTIRDIGFETINKIFIQFEHPWWKEMDGIQLIFRNDNYKDHNWTRHISGFDVMKPGPSNTLLAWVGGRGAIEMEKLTDSQVIHDCIALLAQFTKSEIPAPIKYYCTRWYSNPFVRGAYSYISTDCDKNGTSSRLLSKPITVADLSLSVKGLSTQFAKNLIMPADLDSVNNQRQEVVMDCRIPLILFAGEACHQQYFSTAHGAFLSGIEQAEKILNFCQK
ncbi:spermine oxidase-like [Bradysia coprophila]|uniref:spermine oxidase-like n=1 Tax=Bradysia coprophila TaxID=38358 RepID=UPI00187DB4A7|nr:spermine oxidase-like [Bradysia coprophila]